MDYVAEYLYFIIDPKDTNYVNRIIEGYDYLGVMTTIDRHTGLTVIRTTEGTKGLARTVLESLPELRSIIETKEEYEKILGQ